MDLALERKEHELNNRARFPSFVFLSIVILACWALVEPQQIGMSGLHPRRWEGQKAAVAARIRRVENGLLPAVVIKGRAPRPMNLIERMKHYRVPGVSIAVINQGTVEWARGYGVVEAGSHRPVTPETLFQAASISKPVTAMAALFLVQQGKLSLDGDVNAALVSWKVPENEYTAREKVTLRRLLSHSAGLTVHGFRGYAQGEPLPTLRDILDGRPPANSPPIRVTAVPGQQWRYSGGGYCVVQQLLMDITGKPFPELMRSTVLDRLGMTHSTYQQPLPAEWARQAASGHRSDGAPVKGRWHTYPEMAAAGLWTTAADLARFAIEIQRAWRGESHKVLSRRMIRQMLTPQKDRVGLGLFLRGEGQRLRFYHGGSNAGFRCFLTAYVATGQGAVVMTNSDNGQPLAMEIIRSIAREYGWPDYRPAEKVIAKVDPAIYQAYVGDYELGPGLIITIRRQDGRLFGQASWFAKTELFPESETSYFSPSGLSITFVKNERGVVTGMVVHQGERDWRARRIK
ncbi:MAG: serine hydrolase [Acidobacteria bacterium]|nr:MAG: serine hydrolase [Acidobacteriota bacterium]